MRSLKELATQGLVFLVVSGDPHRKAFAFNFVDRCDRACGRVQCFGQTELGEIGLALPSVNLRDNVVGKKLGVCFMSWKSRVIEALMVYPSSNVYQKSHDT